MSEIKQNKQAGKTAYSGRRRDTTRKSGYKSHEEATGGKFKIEDCEEYILKKGETLEFIFSFPTTTDNHYFGFGLYYRVNASHTTTTSASGKEFLAVNEYTYPNWSKYGSIWEAESTPAKINFKIRANEDCKVDIYNPSCGKVWHKFFNDSRTSVLKNLNIFSPEGLFYTSTGNVAISSPRVAKAKLLSISLKECNRCARYLPVNFENERNTLSFSNHCIAKSPCKHKGFGLLVNSLTQDTLQLTYGFQLECRFCKKFAVNGALNPMRTANQMKEDGQRRRHFELLLSELNGISPQLHYRHATGKELSTEIWRKFGKKCFKCESEISTVNEMNLDHTRPLALLWQLDGTATCLCKSCNSQKRDRFPKDFYTEEELRRLTKITEISLRELLNPTPNIEALSAILKNKEWLFHTFMNKPDLQKIRDGKKQSELVCKALDRVMNLSDLKGTFSFVEELHRLGL